MRLSAFVTLASRLSRAMALWRSSRELIATAAIVSTQAMSNVATIAAIVICRREEIRRYRTRLSVRMMNSRSGNQARMRAIAAPPITVCKNPPYVPVLWLPGYFVDTNTGARTRDESKLTCDEIIRFAFNWG